MSEKNKFALITGAGSGIGRYSALGLLADGWHVALSGRRVDALDETVALAGSDGARALAIPSDVSTPDGVKELAAVSKLMIAQKKADKKRRKKQAADLRKKMKALAANADLAAKLFDKCVACRCCCC